MKNIIRAISFFYNGERVIVKASPTGKFRVPVSEVIDGILRTRKKNLTARQVIEHEIIKNCDPTLYLEGDERLRVYTGGDSSYLPAQAEGLVTKHDEASEPKPLKFAKMKKVLDKPLGSRYSYDQVGMDLYGWWPDDYDDGAD